MGLSKFEQDEHPASKAFLPLYVERRAVAMSRLYVLCSECEASNRQGFQYDRGVTLGFPQNPSS